MAASPTDHPIGSTVKFRAGPTRVPVTATVTGHDGQFVLTKDAAGKERKTRPGAIES
jgi:hypothetical protein